MKVDANTVDTFNVVPSLVSAVQNVYQLRACGIRLVANRETIQTLLEMSSGNAAAEQVASNLFPIGHPSVSLAPEIVRTTEGFVLVRPNTSRRSLTILETLAYRWFGFFPNDCCESKPHVEQEVASS